MTTTTPKESANIVRVKIKNFLSIADVEIAPGQVNQVVGKNNQGKTTVLEAVKFAIVGNPDPSVIKIGEEAAEVTVELSDQTTIRRRINAEGKQTVDVKRDGFKAPSPQSYLDALFDSSSFNPLELLDPKKRAGAILKSIEIKLDAATLAAALGVEEKDLPPLDYNQHGLMVIDQCHKYFFQRRAEANKDAAEKKKRWETYKGDFQAIAEPDFDQVTIDRHRKAVADERKEQEQRLARIADSHLKAKAAQEKLDRYCKAQEDISKKIDETKAKIMRESDVERRALEIQKEADEKIKGLWAEATKHNQPLENEIESLKGRLQESQKFIDEARADVPEALESDDSVKTALANLAKQDAEIDGMVNDLKLYESNKKQAEMIGSMEQEFKVAEAFAQALDARVTALAGRVKADIMAKAEMPLAGLEYVDGEFKVDGVSVDHLSSSKALKLAVGVARKLAKKHRLICIDGAELLDDEAYKGLRAEIEGDGFTYFLTKVGEPFAHEGDKVIKMEAGQVIQ